MKNYDEIAQNVFKRRDEYVVKQKAKKRIIASTVTLMLCCVIVIITSFGLWRNGFFNNNIPVVDDSQNNFVDNNSSEEKNPNESTDITSSQETNVSNGDSSSGNISSEQSNIADNSSQDENSHNDNSTSSRPADNNSSNDNPSTPPVTEDSFLIDSIDKMNFYSAKKIINDNNLLPISTDVNNSLASGAIFLNNGYYEYPIDRNRVFTTTMVTYFTIELNDEKGFLAQKLGGTGTVEVVITENDINDSGQMITFKREDKYYTCFKNAQTNDIDSNKVTREFSSHIYIDGFNTVKNFEQENYEFVVHYEDSKVVGFECVSANSVPQKYNVDSTTFIEDYCVVLFTKQNFTIDQLEMYFRDNMKGLYYEKTISNYFDFDNGNLLYGL